MKQSFLSEYDDSKYQKPSHTVDMVIFTAADEADDNPRRLPEKELKILLIKRKEDLAAKGKDPYKGLWALPGGFVNYTEGTDTAAKRELQEETGLQNVYLEQLFTFGEENDVYRDVRRRVISTAYLALVDSSKLNIIAGDDASDAKWFKLTCKQRSSTLVNTETGYIETKIFDLILTADSTVIRDSVIQTKTVKGHLSDIKLTVNTAAAGLAFDHAKIIFYGLERLRNKTMYTDIAFNLVPEKFTLTEIQKVYETILNRWLAAGYFRAKIKHMVIETNEFAEDTKKRFRKSKLYKFNNMWANKEFEGDTK